MATAKKASAKRSTAKKSSVKKSTKTRAASAAKKSSTKKVAKVNNTTEATSRPKVKVTTSTLSRAPITPMERIRSTHLTTVMTSIFFAILTVFFVGSAGSQLLLNAQARDTFANADSVVLGSASEALFNLEYKYLLIAMLAVSAVGALLLATKLRARYETTVGAGISGFRWIIMGLTAGLTLQLVSFIGGVQDVMTLKVIAGLIVATVVLGWLSDRENATSKNPKWLAFVASLYTGALAWFPLLGSLMGTTVYGGERFGWHVYALAAVVLAGFTGYALTQYSSIKNKNKYEYTVFEQRYLRIDQITKLLVVVIIFSAFAK